MAMKMTAADQQALGVILLSVVVDQPHQGVLPIGAKSTEYTTDIHGAVLVGVADETDRPTRTVYVRGKAGEVAGATRDINDLPEPLKLEPGAELPSVRLSRLRDDARE